MVRARCSCQDVGRAYLFGCWVSVAAASNVGRNFRAPSGRFVDGFDNPKEGVGSGRWGGSAVTTIVVAPIVGIVVGRAIVVTAVVIVGQAVVSCIVFTLFPGGASIGIICVVIGCPCRVLGWTNCQTSCWGKVVEVHWLRGKSGKIS